MGNVGLRVFPLKDDNPTRRTPVVTMLLVAANVAVFLLVQPQGATLLGTGPPTMDDLEAEVRFNFGNAAIPCEIVQGRPLTVEEVNRTLRGEGDACAADPVGPAAFPGKPVWLAVFFSMFLHANLLHLGGNMLFLWIFGNNIEDHLGAVRYVLFYLGAGIVATAAHVAVGPASTIPLIGASGAVAGVMGAYFVWFPRAPILTAIVVGLIFFRRIQARWLLGIWLAMQFVLPGEGVAWVAHVGGFVAGVVVGLVVRASRAVRHAMWRDQWWNPADERSWDPASGPPRRRY